ncbi:uncharacterized protein C3orf20 homolog [Lepisosteus oculatus]|uniref:uncharacterized protein C3orf20 homolog n=1 Tax=Lepisosteus oculatus TaxID=7918 RepID=UPI00371B3B6B
MEIADSLILGPVYFFDQPAGCAKRKKRSRKPIEELPPDLRYVAINPRLAAFLRRGKKGAEEVAGEDNEEIKSKEGVKKKEKTAVLPETGNEPGSVASQDKDPAPGAGQCGSTPAEDAETSPVDEYKYGAPILLAELGRMLEEWEGCGEGIFPRGLVNVLSYSWKELTEGALHGKRQWPSLETQGEKHGKQRSSVPSDKLSDDSPAEKSQRGKSKAKKRVTLQGTTQESTNVLNKQTTATGSKREKKSRKSDNTTQRDHAVDSAQVSHLPVTISFSMSSKNCEEQGWIVLQQEPKPDDPEWTSLCGWAVERLRLAQVPIKEQIAKMEEQGFTKPILLYHYGDARKATIAKHKKELNKNCLFALINGRPCLPELRQEDKSLQKLHYRINDGTSFIYYPSGRIAVCQSHSGLASGGYYTNVFSDSPDPTVVAAFTAFGHGSVCHYNSDKVAVVFDHTGGMMCEEDGTVSKEWKWTQGAKLNEPVVTQVNDFITIRVASPFSASLSYQERQEMIQLSLSPLANTTPPKNSDLGQIVSEGKFSSNTARQLSKANRKKTKELEARKKFMAKNPNQMVTKSSSAFMEMVKTLETLEEEPGYQRGVKAARELKKLQRKIQNILDDWMEHYRIATGINSPDIHKMSDVPQKILLKRKTRSAALPTLPPVGVEETLQPANGNTEQSPSRYLSAPARHNLWDHPRSASKSPRTISTVQKYEKEEQNLISESEALRGPIIPSLDPVVFRSPERSRVLPLSYQPCPVLLREAMLGEGERRMCRCSSHQMPSLTDLELDAFVRGQAPCGQQILVVCVSSSARPQAQPGMGVLEELYEKKNRNRSMPCTQCRLDSFRLVKYDVFTADTCAGSNPCLLVERHNVAPGMFLMYISGKLLFADYIFNGYSSSVKDLQKQIAKTRGDYRMGHCLPADFRFSPQREAQEGVGPPVSQDGPDQREQCHSRAAVPSEDAHLQATDRLPSAQEFVTYTMSKRSHLLCLQKSPPAPFPSLRPEKCLQSPRPHRPMAGFSPRP